MRPTDKQIKTLQNEVTRLTNQVRWLISQIGGPIARFSVVTIYGDYLACNPVSSVLNNDTGNYEDVPDTKTLTNVAKPWLSRLWKWNNPNTITGSDSVKDAFVRDDVVCNYVGDAERTAYQVSTLPATINADTPAVSEDQIINPAYRAGDIIVAVQCDVGIIKNDGGVYMQLTYLDLNVDARAWSINPVTPASSGGG